MSTTCSESYTRPVNQVADISEGIGPGAYTGAYTMHIPMHIPMHTQQFLHKSEICFKWPEIEGSFTCENPQTTRYTARVAHRLSRSCLGGRQHSGCVLSKCRSSSRGQQVSCSLSEWYLQPSGRAGSARSVCRPFGQPPFNRAVSVIL